MTHIFLQGAGPMGGGQQMTIIMIAMFAVLYFFMIRPQQKKQKEQKKFLTELKKGQKIVTMGGIHGKIVQISEDAETLLLEIAEGTKIKIDRSVISHEYSVPAASADKK